MDADVLSNAREAKTNNAKANILANFGGGDLSPRLAGILMLRPGIRRTSPLFLFHWFNRRHFARTRGLESLARM